MTPPDYQTILLNTKESDITDILREEGYSERFLEDTIQHIKDWYRLQPHLPQIPLDETRLKRILIISKFSAEKAKVKIENMLTARSCMPEFFHDRDVMAAHLQHSLDDIDWITLPKVTPQRDRIQILRFKANKIDKTELYDPVSVMSFCFMVGDMRLQMDTNKYDRYVWDLTNMKFAHVRKMTPSVMKKAMFIIERCFGAIIKGIHVVSLPPFAEMVMAVVRSALKKKVADRIIMHDNIEDFFRCADIPKDIIPKDMGGTLDMTTEDITNNWVEAMTTPRWRSLLMELSHVKTDETKRRGASECVLDDLIGMSGSFRKLDID